MSGTEPGSGSPSDAEATARIAANLGVLATTAFLCGPCMWGAPIVLALPISAASLLFAWKASTAGSDAPLDKHLVVIASLTGGPAFLLSTAFLMIGGLYVFVYAIGIFLTLLGSL